MIHFRFFEKISDVLDLINWYRVIAALCVEALEI